MGNLLVQLYTRYVKYSKRASYYLKLCPFVLSRLLGTHMYQERVQTFCIKNIIFVVHICTSNPGNYMYQQPLEGNNWRIESYVFTILHRQSNRKCKIFPIFSRYPKTFYFACNFESANPNALILDFCKAKVNTVLLVIKRVLFYCSGRMSQIWLAL